MDAFVAGIGMTKFGPLPEDSVKSLTAAACGEACTDAGLEPGAVEIAFFSNAMQSYVEGQTTIPGQFALAEAGFEGLPIINVENACASGSTAFHMATRYVTSGAADIALAVGVEKMSFPDAERKRRVMEAFVGGLDIYRAEETLEALAELGTAVDGVSGEGHRTKMMDMYASMSRAHMARFGTTQRQIALIASKNHDHALHNDRCHYRKPFSVEEVLAGRPLAFPLTVPMCSPLSDGAAAAIVCNRRGLKKLARSHPLVRVEASEIATAMTREWADLEHHVSRRAALKAYEAAGVGPEDMDLAEVHDAVAFGELLMTELLGFCPIGEGGPFAESGATRIGGKIPVSTSGGLLSRGHPIGATGLAQIFEMTLQLRGNAGARQVEGARFAIQENGGGFRGVEEGVAVCTILSRLGK